jgi:hypothetical protein
MLLAVQFTILVLGLFVAESMRRMISCRRFERSLLTPAIVPARNPRAWRR